MKTLHSFLMMSALAVCFTACNDEIEGGNVPTETSNSVYLQFSLDLPSGSRSYTEDPDEGDDYVTSSDGTEVGKDYENQINQILLVFTDENNTYLTSTDVVSVSPTTDTENQYVITIPPQRLEDCVSPEPEEGTEETGTTSQKTAYVYAFCNPTDELRALAGASAESARVEDFINKAHTLTDGESENASVWQSSNFLMSNAVKQSITLPTSWNEHLSSSHPFNIGTIEVERSAARFDYKAKNEGNRYAVRKNLSSSEDETDNPGIYIELTDIALINMSKSFYYLRRVSDDGQNDLSTVCGVETANNYVVDTDAKEKVNYTSAENWTNKTDNFFYNLEKPETWQWTSLATISNNTEDNIWGKDEEETKGYHIWRYAIENTIPQDEQETDALQKNGITTGVVFRAKIGITEDSDVTWTAGEPIYVFENKLYGNWEAVANYATVHSNSNVAYAYRVVTNGDYDYKGAGFTIYEANEDGNYYTYYYYWNRHNDNGKVPDMGPMEFAVVRNNVYKLSVEAIYRFGYPEGETPDPETPDEEEPDPDPEEPDPEAPKVFFEVKVQVLPWVVRVNSIEFGKKDTGTNK